MAGYDGDTGAGHMFTEVVTFDTQESGTIISVVGTFDVKAPLIFTAGILILRVTLLNHRIKVSMTNNFTG